MKQLKNRYYALRTEAVSLMRSGDLTGYLITLKEMELIKSNIYQNPVTA